MATKCALAQQAISLIESDPTISSLPSQEKKIQAVSGLVGLGSSKGVNPNNLRNWLKDISKLEAACEVSSSCLNAEGKHTGGRGNRKPGREKRIANESGVPWFPDLEKDLKDRILSARDQRKKVTTSMIRGWMLTLVGKAKREFAEEEKQEENLAHLNSFRCSAGWLRRFLKRYDFVQRRATNKRAHSPEDLLGDVLGFVRFLRQLRRDNPDSADPTWGA